MTEQYPKTVLVLIRHGQASGSKSGDYGRMEPLTDLGRRQVLALATDLQRGQPVDALYTSPFSRALETAELLSDKLGLEPVVEPRLAEFEIEGVTIEAVVKRRLDVLRWKPEHRSATGETLADFCARVATFCEEIVRLHVGERVVVVCHGGTIGGIIRWSLGIGPNTPWEHGFEIPNALTTELEHGFEIPNASITELEHWPDGRVKVGSPRFTVVLRVGDATHLGEIATDI